MIEQPLFAIFATAVSRQAAVGAEHAVTGHDDGDAIVAVCASDGACCSGPANSFAELVVDGGFSERHFEQLVPDALLERSADDDERDREYLPRSVEVFAELFAGLIEESMLAERWRAAEEFVDARELSRQRAPVAELTEQKAAIVCDRGHRSERCVDQIRNQHARELSRPPKKILLVRFVRSPFNSREAKPENDRTDRTNLTKTTELELL